MNALLRLLALIVVAACVYTYFERKGQAPHLFGGQASDRHVVPVVLDLSNEVLVPLEGGKAPSTASAQQAISTLNARISSQSSNPDRPRCLRALSLLSAALDERQALIQKALEKASEGPFDKTPDIKVWHDAWDRKKVIDIEDVHRAFRSNYWAGVYLAKWRERCTYYHNAIEATLAQP